MHAVQKALDDAEGDEAAHVDGVEGGDAVEAELSDALALFQPGVQLHQFGAGDQVGVIVVVIVPQGRRRRRHRGVRVVAIAGREGDVVGALELQLGAFDEGGQLGRGRVDGAEAEDVEDENAVVVEQVAQRLAHQGVVGIGRQSDLGHAVDAVNVREDEQEGQVPVLVDQRREPHSGKGDMVRQQGRRGRVGGEELDVERVGIVDGDHGFAVVVQVLEQDFAQGVDFPRVGRGGVAREEVRLLFQRAQQRRQFERHRQVRRVLGGAVEHEAEIEQELVARIQGRWQADGVSEDAVRVGDDGEQSRAELLPRNDVAGYIGEMKKRNLSADRRWDDGVGGDLVQNFWAWEVDG